MNTFTKRIVCLCSFRRLPTAATARRRCPILALCLHLLGAGCGLAESEDESYDIGQIQAAVIDGDVVTSQGSGFVFFTSSVGFCSGTLMTNEWVLTARHCFGAADVASPNNVGVVMGAQSSSAVQIELLSSNDVALLRLAVPMTMNGASTGFRRRLNPNPTNSLTPGTLLTCFGFGINDWNNQSGSNGILRTATLAVRGVNFNWWFSHYDLAVQMNSRGQFLASGDSGGSCLFSLPSGERVVAGVSVVLHKEFDGTFNGLVDPDQFRNWYSNLVAPPQTGTSQPAPSECEVACENERDECIASAHSGTERGRCVRAAEACLEECGL